MTAALAELEAREQIQAAELEQLRGAIGIIRGFTPIGTNGRKSTSAVVGKTRRSPVAPGSLPDRILAILREAGEPVKTKHVIEHAKARPHSVKVALWQLVKDKRIVRTGATASLRYAVV